MKEIATTFSIKSVRNPEMLRWCTELFRASGMRAIVMKCEREGEEFCTCLSIK